MASIRERLTRWYPTIVADMIPKELCDQLIRNEVLSIQEAKELEDPQGGETDMARKLVALLDQKPDDILVVFVQCLRDSYQGHVADLLDGVGEFDVELRLSVRNPEMDDLEAAIHTLALQDDKPTPSSLDVSNIAENVAENQPSPATLNCTCRGLENAIRESMHIANDEMQKYMLQQKLDLWKSYEETINNCFKWLQELRECGCRLKDIRNACVILEFTCQNKGFDFLWQGVSSGQLSNELTAIFRDLYAEMHGIDLKIDVTITPLTVRGACGDRDAMKTPFKEIQSLKTDEEFDNRLRSIVKHLDEISKEIVKIGPSSDLFTDVTDASLSRKLPPEQNVLRHATFALKDILSKCPFISEGYITSSDAPNWNWAVDKLNQFHDWYFKTIDTINSPKTPQTPKDMDKFPGFVDMKGRKEASVFLTQLENLAESLEHSEILKDFMRHKFQADSGSLDLRCQPLSKVYINRKVEEAPKNMDPKPAGHDELCQKKDNC